MSVSAISAGIALAALLALGPGCASGLAGGARAPAAAPGAAAGIEVTAVRVSAAGRVVDFRYRVVDPGKAREVLSRQTEVYAIDQATGVRLPVPRAGKVGALRQSASQAVAGKVYFVLFGNTGGVVKPGSLVTVVLGGVRIADLPVE